jgi:hypothetical protein
MMRIPIISIALLAGLCLAGTTLAQGTAGFEVLRLPTYPRGTALGGAVVADSGNIESVYYNPAGLAAITQRCAVAGYMAYLIDIKSGLLAYVEPRGKWGVWGANITYTNYGKFDKRDNTGVDLGTFYASDITLGLTYAYPLKPNLGLGTNAKFVYSKIDHFTGTALAFDLGGQYQVIPGRMRLGAGIFNLGWTTSAYVQTRDKLPVVYRLGVTGNPEGLPATLFFTMSLNQDMAENHSLGHFDVGQFLSDIYYGLGAEFRPVESFYLRLGYNTQGQDERVGTSKDYMAGMSGGVGFDMTLMRLDIGFASHGELGFVTRAAISANF